MAKMTAPCRQCGAKTKVAESRAALVACDGCGQMLNNPWREESRRAAKAEKAEPRWLRTLLFASPFRVKMFGISLGEVLMAAGAAVAIGAYVIQRFDLLA